mgnify:CR=1 FL=1
MPAYYADIRGGRPVAPEHLDDLVSRYRRLRERLGKLELTAPVIVVRDFDELKARAAGRPDIEMPRLPQKEIEEIRRRYVAVAEAYSGQKI